MRVEIFGHGGGKEEAARQDVPSSGKCPSSRLREGGDRERRLWFPRRIIQRAGVHSIAEVLPEETGLICHMPVENRDWRGVTDERRAGTISRRAAGAVPEVSHRRLQQLRFSAGGNLAEVCRGMGI